MYCCHCGKMIEDNSRFCCHCGRAQGVTGPGAVRMVKADPGLDPLIPRNACALWAYYLGIFSLICFALALPALVTGILGVRHADLHPEAKGKIHAWVGIVLGGLGTLMWAFLIVMMIGSRFRN